jgi:hypothetical protein
VGLEASVAAEADGGGLDFSERHGHSIGPENEVKKEPFAVKIPKIPEIMYFAQ